MRFQENWENSAVAAPADVVTLVNFHESARRAV
ncbi:hypothetical protein J2W22_000430 [Sphingomonas kyeonggiensis]|nr:hypothetical protein [Sphingomonas kyeonggiensis]